MLDLTAISIDVTFVAAASLLAVAFIYSAWQINKRKSRSLPSTQTVQKFTAFDQSDVAIPVEVTAEIVAEAIAPTPEVEAPVVVEETPVVEAVADVPIEAEIEAEIVAEAIVPTPEVEAPVVEAPVVEAEPPVVETAPVAEEKPVEVAKTEIPAMEAETKEVTVKEKPIDPDTKNANVKVEPDAAKTTPSKASSSPRSLGFQSQPAKKKNKKRKN